jgi:hypothetical protein
MTDTKDLGQLLYEMELHEELFFRTVAETRLTIMRLPGGWSYQKDNENSFFVPYNEELKGNATKDFHQERNGVGNKVALLNYCKVKGLSLDLLEIMQMLIEVSNINLHELSDIHKKYGLTYEDIAVFYESLVKGKLCRDATDNLWLRKKREAKTTCVELGLGPDDKLEGGDEK